MFKTLKIAAVLLAGCEQLGAGEQPAAHTHSRTPDLPAR